jgi:hypothetical protein
LIYVALTSIESQLHLTYLNTTNCRVHQQLHDDIMVYTPLTHLA